MAEILKWQHWNRTRSTRFLSVLWFISIGVGTYARNHLLDLAFTDVANCSVDVLPYIADHKIVMSYLPLPEVLETNVPRDVWVFAKADWSSLSEALGKYNWANLEEGSAEDALAYFLEILWLHLVKFIPRKSIVTRKSTHPWLNEKCKEAVLRKNRAEGTGNFGTECENCNRILNVERAAWMQRTKDQLAALPRSSKKWWRLNRLGLLHKRALGLSHPSFDRLLPWYSSRFEPGGGHGHKNFV